MNIEGIIIDKNKKVYTITNGKETFTVYSENNLDIGQCGQFTLTMGAHGYKCQDFVQRDEVYDKVYKKVYDSLEYNRKEWLIKDDVTECIKRKGVDVIKHIITSHKLGRKIMVRFHNDADGIVGGLAMKMLLGKILNFQNRGAIYTPMFAINDISLLHNTFKPMVILIDFGSADENKEGLTLLKSAGIETIIIDHHPYDEKPEVDYYISPWECGGDSQYPAGYITCELVMEFTDNDMIPKLRTISLAGDKSNLIHLSDDDKNKAIILDYLAVYSRFPNTLSFYESVLTDENILRSIGMMTDEKIGAIKKTAKHYVKEKKFDGLTLVLLHLDKLVKRQEFPSKSKAAGAVFEMYDDSVILIGYGKKLITLRISHNAQKIITAREIIKEMKRLYPEGVISGGGHDGAASMRCDPVFTDIIVDEVVKLIEMKVDGNN